MIEPNEVKARAKKLEGQNYSFRKFLKMRADRDELDAQFLELHNELFEGFDCCKCSNCCKYYRIFLSSDEVVRIAGFLGLSQSRFAEEYLADAGDEGQYELSGKPCLFLGNDGRCRIEDCKPEVCVDFPYTDQPDRLSSMFSIIEHAEICPVVFEILERLKEMYGFKNRT